MVKFGVFDHLDDAGVPLGELYANRLQFAEALDRGGFHAYHLAEHHNTPLGMAASPGIFLSAVAQRTTTLRFGPMVYLLPFYHPMRLIEEICMLDQMSGGRLELGIGRGVSPFETANYALDFAQTQGMYHEAFQALLKGLTTDELTFSGKFYNFNKVPMLLHPVQRPHPPFWYGVNIPENADWPAANDVNVISLALSPAVRPIFDRYRGDAQQTRQARYDILRHRPPCDRRRHRCEGDGDSAAGLSEMARQFLLAVQASWLGAAGRRDLPRDFRGITGARCWRCRLAGDRARLYQEGH